MLLWQVTHSNGTPTPASAGASFARILLTFCSLLFAFCSLFAYFVSGLVMLALLMDGIYGPYQNKITAEIKKTTGEELSPYHLMFNMNFYQV
jgi:hypothetical protein